MLQPHHVSCLQLPVPLDTLATTEGPAAMQHSTAHAQMVSKELIASSLPVSLCVSSAMWCCIACTMQVGRWICLLIMHITCTVQLAGLGGKFVVCMQVKVVAWMEGLAMDLAPATVLLATLVYTVRMVSWQVFVCLHDTLYLFIHRVGGLLYIMIARI